MNIPDSEFIEHCALEDLHNAADESDIQRTELASLTVGSAFVSVAPQLPSSAIVINRVSDSGSAPRHPARRFIHLYPLIAIAMWVDISCRFIRIIKMLKISYQFILSWIVILLIFITLPITVCSAEGQKVNHPTADATTIADPFIPAEELALLVRPLSKSELLIEAVAWQSLVKDAAREFARAEIAIQRENREINKEDKLTIKIRQTQKSLEDLIYKTEKAKDTRDFSALPGIQDTIDEVQDTMGEIETAVDDFATAHNKTEEIAEKMSGEARNILKQHTDAGGNPSKSGQDTVSDAVENIETETMKRLEGINDDNLKRSNQSIGAQEQQQTLLSQNTITTFEQSIATLEKAEDATKKEKVTLLEEMTKLREKRTRLLDNFRTVIDELQAKTDSSDSETLAIITDHKLYISRVSGIHVDITDTTSTWVTLKGWFFSDRGGKRWAFNSMKFIGILLITMLLAKLLNRMVKKLAARLKVHALLQDFLPKSASWLVFGIGIIWALSALEFSIAPLLAMVGAASFVIAFAMQDSLSNFAAGMMILIFRPFNLDDVVDAGGVSGKVSSMNLVATTIRTFDNKLMIVPNSRIWNDVITNATGVTQRRVDMVFGIGYDDDTELAQTILEKIVADHPLVLKTPEPMIKLSELADSSVNFICRPWVFPADYWDVYWDVTREVKKGFDAAGIGIPYPQRDVHLHITDDNKAMIKGETDKAK